MDCSIILLGAEPSYWLNPSTWWAILQVVLGLGFVIFVHELGHFLVAKACGVKCEKFYVGFDVPIKVFGVQILPATLFKTQFGETEYGIGMIPFGGYVKMLGQDDNPSNMQAEIERSRGETDNDGQMERDGFVDRTALDPRSFRAKSVPQRMAIISAGVIFNLAFAVLFAAMAFRAGVDYQPAAIGSVTGGGPAWQQNLAGATLHRVADEVITKDRYFPYGDMAQVIIFSGDEGPVEFEVSRFGSDAREVIEMVPQKGLNRNVPDFPLVGIESRLIPTVARDDAIPGNPAVDAQPKLKKNDRIIEVNGTSISNMLELRLELARRASEPVELLVERPSEDKDAAAENVAIKIGTNPVRELGFGGTWLPVTAIQVDSPAEAAGFQVGDLVLSVDGQEMPSVLDFDFRMQKHLHDGGSNVEFVVQRGDENVTLSLTPVLSPSNSVLGSDGVLALDSIGLAVKVSETVATLDPDGPAEKAGIKIGDKIQSVKYLLAEEYRDLDYFAKVHEKLVHLKDDKTSLAEIYAMIQSLPVGTSFEFAVARGGKTETVTVATTASERYFQGKRGFAPQALKWNYQSPTWSDAITNGAARVRSDAGRVWQFLTKLVTGKLSPKNLGGPGTIAVVATSEASAGTSHLLLFLTMLSANLAIVNFLPIPVLDGGHMLFLAYEGLFRRPVSEKVEILLTYAGLFFILGLMVFVSVMDVSRISKWFF